MDVTERGRLLDEVNAAVARYFGELNDFRAHIVGIRAADPAAVLNAELPETAFALCAIADNLAGDDEVLDAVGWLFWCRAAELGEGRGNGEGINLAISVNLFNLLRQRQPDLVPVQMRQLPTNREGTTDGLEAASVLMSWYQESGDANALTAATRVTRHEVRELPVSPLQVSARAFLAIMLRTRYELDGDMTALDEAITVMKTALRMISPADPARASYERLLADLRRLASREEEAEDEHQVADQDLGERGLERARAALSDLKRFDETGDFSYLRAAIAAFRELIDTSSDGPQRLIFARALVTALLMLDEHGLDVDALAEAISLLRDITNAEPEDADFLKLGGALMRYSDFTNDPAAVEEGIGLLAPLAAGHTRERPTALRMLGYLLGMRYQQSSLAEPPAETLAVLREAVAASDDRGIALANLGNTLMNRAWRVPDPGAVEEATRVLREALQATPPDVPERITLAVSLSAALDEQFLRTGAIDVLGDAVAIMRQALERAPAEHPDRAWWLARFSLTLQRYFEATGGLDLIAEAVSVAREAVAVPGLPPSAAPLALHALGRALLDWYEQTGDAAALEESISTTRQSVRLRPDGDRGIAEPLSTLGLALWQSSRRPGNGQALDAAITALRQAVAASPAGSPSKATHLSNLGLILAVQAQTTGNADRSEIVRLDREAVALTPDGHAAKPPYLSNLATAIMESTPASAEPVALLRQAVEMSPPGDPRLPSYLHNLGSALARRKAFDEAAGAFRRAALASSAAPGERIVSGRDWAFTAAASGDLAGSLTAMSATLDVVPQLAPRYLRRADAQFNVAQLAGLGRDVAAIALRAGSPGQAIALLEMGRGALLIQALETCGDEDAIRDRDPVLAERFVRLRDALNEPRDPLADASPATAWRVSEHRRTLATQWERLLTEIRLVKGLEGFQRPPRAGELRSHAQAGPIAVLNVSEFTSHAFILTSDEIAAVALPGVTLEAVTERAAGLFQAVDGTRDNSLTLAQQRRCEDRILDTLEWLWDEITAPVLGRLGLVSAPGPGHAWTRLWWCPTGPLGALPVHGAGYHRSVTGDDAVLNRVISSYTPTIAALAHARQRSKHSGDGPTLIVGPSPGAGLPGAEREAAELVAILPEAAVLPGDSATGAEVLAALPRYRNAHFACHGVTDLSDPSKSALIFTGGDGNLTVAHISQLDLREAGLAFLSACDTTRTSQDLIDEAIHLTSGFLLAGYPNVIGTLWEIDDTMIASRIAADVYQNPGGGPAEALHHAIRNIRGTYSGKPSLWAAHIHVGA